MRVPRSVAFVLAKPPRGFLPAAALHLASSPFPLFSAAFCFASLLKRSRAGIAVESRAICPISRSFWVSRDERSHATAAATHLRRTRRNARENFDSCGSAAPLGQPQNCRNDSSTRSRRIRSRVVGRFRMALAMKAVASALRSFAGRPVELRRTGNNRSERQPARPRQPATPYAH